MGRVTRALTTLGVFLVMLSPWGRRKLLAVARNEGVQAGQFMLARQLANMNRDRRRLVIRHIVKTFKKK